MGLHGLRLEEGEYRGSTDGALGEATFPDLCLGGSQTERKPGKVKDIC